VTASAALAASAFEAPPLEVTPPAGSAFTYEPLAAEVTSTLAVQLPLAGIVPPLSESEPPPAMATVEPPQVVDPFGTAALTRFGR
jgi:hypothetical protein